MFIIKDDTANLITHTAHPAGREPELDGGPARPAKRLDLPQPQVFIAINRVKLVKSLVSKVRLISKNSGMVSWNA